MKTVFYIGQTVHGVYNNSLPQFSSSISFKKKGRNLGYIEMLVMKVIEANWKGLNNHWYNSIATKHNQYGG